MEETPREYYKRHGICPKCRKKKALDGFVHCEDCLEKIRINNIKYRDKQAEYERRRRERRKVISAQRVVAGICTQCGKKPSWNGLQLCAECRRKILNRRKRKEYSGRAPGESFRKRMNAGLCMLCGDPQAEGYKLCEKHLEMQREKIRKMVKNKKVYREENDAFWRGAISKNSENG